VLIFLDSNVVIYLIEQPPNWGQRAAAQIQMFLANKDRLVVSDLTRLECRVRPISVGDAALLAQFDAFFASADVQVAALTPQVCDRATLIRAKHRYRTPDALNLAAALEFGCGLFVTNDGRLTGFPDVSVQILA
jgi:uncharacterized protein